MSATNWATCPKCSQTQKEKPIYGETSEEDCLASMKIAGEPILDTLREDYEIYFDAGGNFKIYYGCSCEVCGFKFSYDYEKPVLEKT